MKRFLVTLLGAGGTLVAQGTGDYFNVESPQVKPIAVARVAGHDYLLVCNTPDNSVEIYDTHTNGFVTRVRTGPEPVSVEFNPVTQRLYTANFLGDSVTVASLSATGPLAPLQVQFETTLYVGDEPADVAFSLDGSLLLVSLSSRSVMRVLDAATLVPSPTLDPVVLSAGSPIVVVKEPRAIVVAPAAGSTLGRVIVANAKGGKTPAVGGTFPYDLDLWSMDLGVGLGSAQTRAGLGTTNHGVAVAQNGDIWVCGTDALFPGAGVAGHATQPTGFVRSMLWRVPAAGGVADARDINTQAPTTNRVSFAEALAQPTDLVLLERSGSVEKVYLAAFHSDRLGIVSPVGPSATWGIKRIDIGLTSQPNPGAVSGPRGLALKAPSGLVGDPGSRLYVMNRLDNSVAVVDTTTDALVTTFALRHDPTPSYIKKGREFLYSAKLSGNGFVSCASCHVDGRTDNLGWDLSNNTAAPFPGLFVDGVVPLALPTGPYLPTSFPANKGVLVTQTLQGLATWEVNAGMQFFFSTQPLHWRGDKARFEDFNEAFVNLQGMPNQFGTPTDPKGIPDDKMEAFRAFVFSIHYPSNPEQPIHRVYSGSIGQPNVIGSGTGASEGNKLFHQRGLTQSPGGTLCNGRSCVQCHALMSGGNRMFTDIGLSLQPLESAALRLLRQREAAIEVNGSVTPSTFFMGNFGLDHLGQRSSINGFNLAFFADFPITSELFHVNQFVREFDTGTAPAVGLSFTITNTTPAAAVNAATFFGQDQAQRANAGLAVQAVIGGVERGFWYDVPTDRYLEEPPTTPRTRAQLLALLAGPGDRLVFHGTPLGSERRFAWPLIGSPPALTGPAPSGLTLEPMPTNTAWADVPGFVHNWDPLAAAPVQPFTWGGGGAVIPTPPSLLVMRNIQRELVAQQNYGVKGVKHEAPRRFAVAGNDIRHGAVLWLFVNTDMNQTPWFSTSFEPIALPLHPTSRTNEAGLPIWESHVELDPFMLYVFLAGGPFAKGPVTTILNVFSQTWTAETLPPGTIDANTWNWYYVFVQNRDGSLGGGGLQQLRLQ